MRSRTHAAPVATMLTIVAVFRAVAQRRYTTAQ
jgi:hypothetical protein